MLHSEITARFIKGPAYELQAGPQVLLVRLVIRECILHSRVLSAVFIMLAFLLISGSYSNAASGYPFTTPESVPSAISLFLNLLIIFKDFYLFSINLSRCLSYLSDLATVSPRQRLIQFYSRCHTSENWYIRTLHTNNNSSVVLIIISLSSFTAFMPTTFPVFSVIL